jgi:small subunit ribosomal protein S1
MNQPHQPPSVEAWSAFVARSSGPLEGVVSAVVPFGAFVRFDEGVDGLIPIAEVTQVINVGDRVAVRVLELDPENRRVSLRQI